MGETRSDPKPQGILLVRCLLGKAKVRAVFVMVSDVFGKQPFKMVFTKSDEVIHQVAAAAANPALREAILPWASEGSLKLD